MDTLSVLKESLPSCSKSEVVAGTSAGYRKRWRRRSSVSPEGAKALEPLWKRRGVKEMKPLKLDPIIKGDNIWLMRPADVEPLLQIVLDCEWVSQRTCYEVHSMSDIEEGVVINPPSYPPWFRAQRTGKVVPAYFPYSAELLLMTAQRAGKMPKVVSRMGDLAMQYIVNLINARKKDTSSFFSVSSTEILILAGRIWQGAAAINAARRLRVAGYKVSVYIHGGSTLHMEELEYQLAGGTIYRKLNDLKKCGKTFNFTIVALENQYMGRTTILPVFSQWLQTSTALFLDPPILKCSYSTALQIACKGSYNISNKTAIMMPAIPKPYMEDKFVDLFVTDVGIPMDLYRSCGIVDCFDFKPNGKPDPASFIVPEPFKENKGKIYFYKNKKRVL